MNKPQRDFNAIVESCLSPGSPFDIRDLRMEAVLRVLAALPAEPFDKLSDMIDEFCWFVPHYEQLGYVYPFYVTDEGGHHLMDTKTGPLTSAPFSRVLYLSPRLEDVEDEDVIAGIVVHELAHIYHRHKLVNSEEVYDAQETEVTATVSKWGFGKEWDAAERWHQSQEQ